MLELFYLPGLIICLLILVLGLRQGLMAPLTMLGFALLAGFYLRYPVIATATTFYGHSTILARFGVGLDIYAFADLIIIQIFILLGYYLDSAVGGKRISNFFVSKTDIPLPRIKPFVCWLIFGGSWAFFFYALSAEFGGLAQGLDMLQRRVQLDSSDITIASSFLTVGLGALCLLAAKSASRGRLFWISVAVAIAHVYLIFLTGGRQLTIIHALAIGGALFWNGSLRSKLSPGTAALVILSLAIVVGIMTAGLAMRTAAQTGMDFSAAFAIASSDLPRQLSDTFNTYDLYIGAKHYADSVGFTFGTNFTDMFGRFIPRSIWPDKPLTLNLQLREYFYRDRLSGVPPTLFGEFYIAFGAFGLAVGSFIYGGVLRILARLRYAGLQSPVMTSIYVYVSTTLIIGTVKTGIEIGIFLIIYFLVGVWISRFVSRIAFVSPSINDANK